MNIFTEFDNLLKVNDHHPLPYLQSVTLVPTEQTGHRGYSAYGDALVSCLLFWEKFVPTNPRKQIDNITHFIFNIFLYYVEKLNFLYSG